MKLVRYGPAGKEKPGLVDADGKLRDLSKKVKDIDAAALAPAKLRELAKLDPRKLPLVKGRPRLGACVAMPSKFVAIGLNFSDHARETGSPIPEYPGRVLQVDDVHRRPERQRDDPEGLDAARLGGRARRRDRPHRALRRREGRAQARRRLLRRQRRLRARLPAEEERRASGARARAATRSARWVRGSSPPTRSRTRRISRCGSTSTASAGSGQARRR